MTSYRSLSLIPTFSNYLPDRITQMDRLFSRLTGEKPLGDNPAYNLRQKDKNHYELTFSVPGYSQDELEISVHNHQITISGKASDEKNESEDEKEGVKWLHQGISKNGFSVNFSLEHRITIQQATLDKGLLTLQFIYEIPEQEKPQKIPIGVQNESGCVIEHNAA
ncbi:Hsp20 family protein [Arsenophonus nasoniae]|uniref:Hsp20 family protein n=1 Tax=Arsenophonus nasoniae TaxID=638 RepID=UPI003879A27D